MRLLILTPLYVPWVGGLEIFVRQLVSELRPRGHDLLIVTSAGPEARSGFDEVDGVPVLRVAAHRALARRDPGGLFEVQRSITRTARDFAPDLVHSHDAGPILWMYLRSARNRRVPLMVTVHNVMTRQPGGETALRASLLEAHADWITGVSEDVVDDLIHFAPSVAGRTEVIRNGVVPLHETVTPVPTDPPRLLCVGRLVPQKGFDRAVEAFARIAPRRPDASMTVAGDGAERATLEALAAELGVADRVHFVGMVERAEVARLLDQSTAVIMPSYFEGLPLVALEAAWAGRPVVATRAPGLTRAVLDGETAIVVDGDGADLSLAMERLISNPRLAAALGTGARALAEREFSLATCADRYESRYSALLRQ